jgi:hypothetical protein
LQTGSSAGRLGQPSRESVQRSVEECRQHPIPACRPNKPRIMNGMTLMGRVERVIWIPSLFGKQMARGTCEK